MITADSGKSAYDVADLMKNKKVGSIIVMDKKSQPLGIITERDMVKRYVSPFLHFFHPQLTLCYVCIDYCLGKS
jgi:CBS domain-containing protein